VFANEQVRARGVELSLKNAEGKPVPGVANPIRYSATPIAYEKAPPRVGEDTEAVLERLLGQVAS
jgi:crotonobetainyl-CoA:carnitine CoA-transferase CaiB-like acyl-CoA transferase